MNRDMETREILDGILVALIILLFLVMGIALMVFSAAADGWLVKGFFAGGIVAFSISGIYATELKNIVRQETKNDESR